MNDTTSQPLLHFIGQFNAWVMIRISTPVGSDCEIQAYGWVRQSYEKMGEADRLLIATRVPWMTPKPPDAR